MMIYYLNVCINGGDLLIMETLFNNILSWNHRANSPTWKIISDKTICDTSSYKMEIDNSNSDAVIIDKVFVRVVNNEYFGIDTWCIPDNNNYPKTYAPKLQSQNCAQAVIGMPTTEKSTIITYI